MTMFRSLLRCEGGASVVEMGLAAPILATMLMGMMDVSRAYSSKLQLEQAAQRTIEKVEQQRSVSTDYSTLATEAAAAAGVPATQVKVDFWLECNGVRQGDGTAGNGFNGQCTDASANIARYVSVAITSYFTPMFPAKFPGSNADGTYTFVGKAGVRVQ